MYIGTIVKLKTPLLNEVANTLGICYRLCQLNKDVPGASFIFENGNYGDLTLKEQNLILHTFGFCDQLADYQFKNIPSLLEDFKSNKFSVVFKDKQFQVYQFIDVKAENKEPSIEKK